MKCNRINAVSSSLPHGPDNEMVHFLSATLTDSNSTLGNFCPACDNSVPKLSTFHMTESEDKLRSTHSGSICMPFIQSDVDLFPPSSESLLFFPGADVINPIPMAFRFHAAVRVACFEVNVASGGFKAL